MPVSPPRPKGPPLNALRAFEAAARLGGFTAAAQELSVTPGAIAQQIKIIEAWAGARLFERHAQGVRLTALGGGVVEDFSTAFDQLGEAVQALRHKARPRHLRIASLPCLAQLWLSPRLPDLRMIYPDLCLDVTAMEYRPNLMREPYDLSLFYMKGEVPETAIMIEQDRLFPVCSPEMARNLSCPQDLEKVNLLHDSSWAEDWKIWSEAAELSIETDTGLVFSLYSLALDEALHGAGVLMGHASLVQKALETGQLVCPFGPECPLEQKLVIDISNALPKVETEKLVSDLMKVV